MTRNRTNIRKIATDLLARFEIDHPPIPVEKLARSLSVEIRYTPYEGEISGVLFQKGETTIIGVNSAHHQNRQRFTIAHELGHFLMHPAREIYVDNNYSVRFRRDSGKGKEEYEANLFAAELLMPKAFIESDLNERDIDIESDTIVEELAKQYKVSSLAMSIRLSDLLDL